jgi:hypothetical protein
MLMSKNEKKLLEFKKIAENKGGKCLSVEYNNINSNLDFTCSEGHEFSATPNNIKHNGGWCKKCRYQKVRDNTKISGLNRLRSLALSNNGKILSITYTDVYSKYSWQCDAGHKWCATPAIAKTTWCKICTSIKKINYKVGDKHNMLTIISIEGPGNSLWSIGNTVALCKCKCGKTSKKQMKYLVSGNTKSCGCLKTVSLVGDRFGSLKVLKKLGSHKKRGIKYLCSCDCGNEVIKYTSNLTQHRQGRQQCISCGCHIKKRRMDSILKNRLRKYKVAAQARGIVFRLKDFDFFELIQKPCHYCGQAPRLLDNRNENKTLGTLAVNGVDRVDSEIPYEINNVVPCCKFCNLAKLDWSKEYFLDKLDKIYKKWGLDGKD